MTINIVSNRYRGKLDVIIKIDGETVVTQSIELEGKNTLQRVLDEPLPIGKELHISGILTGNDLKNGDAAISEQFDQSFELLDLSAWTSCLRDDDLNALERLQALQDGLKAAVDADFVRISETVTPVTDTDQPRRSAIASITETIIKPLREAIYQMASKNNRTPDEALIERGLATAMDQELEARGFAKQATPPSPSQEKTLLSNEKRLGVTFPQVLHPFEHRDVYYCDERCVFSDPAKLQNLMEFHYDMYGPAEAADIMPKPGTDDHSLYERLMVVGVEIGDGHKMLVWDSKEDIWFIVEEGYGGSFEPAPLKNRVTNAPLTQMEALLCLVDPVGVVSQDDDNDDLVAPLLGRSPTHPVITYDSQAPSSETRIEIGQATEPDYPFKPIGIGATVSWFDATKMFER